MWCVDRGSFRATYLRSFQCGRHHGPLMCEHWTLGALASTWPHLGRLCDVAHRIRCRSGCLQGGHPAPVAAASGVQVLRPHDVMQLACLFKMTSFRSLNDLTTSLFLSDTIDKLYRKSPPCSRNYSPSLSVGRSLILSMMILCSDSIWHTKQLVAQNR